MLQEYAATGEACKSTILTADHSGRLTRRDAAIQIKLAGSAADCYRTGAIAVTVPTAP